MMLVTNAIKETPRFHPIVPQLPRVASKDDVLPLSQPIISATGATIDEIPITAGPPCVHCLALNVQALLAELVEKSILICQRTGSWMIVRSLVMLPVIRGKEEIGQPFLFGSFSPRMPAHSTLCNTERFTCICVKGGTAIPVSDT
ncbi:hypothetical protein C8Q74DRAFT_727505 [Fomes fomentarius]|nr:hypothetical protein C8Q74DRAFT_727505 [Fomes fomentarius]